MSDTGHCAVAGCTADAVATLHGTDDDGPRCRACLLYDLDQ